MRRLLAALAASLVAVVGFPAPASGHVSESLYEARLVRRINEANGLHLERSRCLDRYAQGYANRLAGGAPFEHKTLGPTMTGCGSSMVGEVLGYGEARPRVMVQAWLLSPLHKAVLMRPYHRYVGVGVVRMEHGWMVVVRFADEVNDE